MRQQSSKPKWILGFVLVVVCIQGGFSSCFFRQGENSFKEITVFVVEVKKIELKELLPVNLAALAFTDKFVNVPLFTNLRRRFTPTRRGQIPKVRRSIDPVHLSELTLRN